MFLLLLNVNKLQKLFFSKEAQKSCFPMFLFPQSAFVRSDERKLFLSVECGSKTED
jgi:hypothetical protein